MINLKTLLERYSESQITSLANDPVIYVIDDPTGSPVDGGMLLSTFVRWLSSAITNGAKYVPSIPVKEIEFQNDTQNLNVVRIINKDDASNYSGSIFVAKGSGADFTNNIYLALYGAGFYIPSWAGNGVLASDKKIIISSFDDTNGTVEVQVGGGNTTPTTKLTIDKDKAKFANQVTGGHKILTFSAVASFDLNDGNSQEMPVTNDITSLDITNEAVASSYTIYLVVDGTARVIPTPGASFGTKTSNSADFDGSANAVNIVNILVSPSGLKSYTIMTY